MTTWIPGNSYSVNNTIAIYLQRPDASLVCRYTDWKKHNRIVTHGQKGIKIIISPDFIPLDPEADYVLNQYGLFETTYDEKDKPICTKRMAADGSVIVEYPNMTAEDVLAPYIKSQ